MTITDTPPGGDTVVAPIEKTGKLGDRIFGGISLGAGILILVTLAAVALFLFVEAWPTFGAEPSTFNESFSSYVAPLLFGTIWAAFLALLLALPLAVAVALFVSHYAPKRLAVSFGYFIDLLAAIPSVVFGLWGIAVLAPILSRSVYPWLEDNLGFLPFFAGPASTSGRTMMTVAVVLAFTMCGRALEQILDPRLAERT